MTDRAIVKHRFWLVIIGRAGRYGNKMGRCIPAGQNIRRDQILMNIVRKDRFELHRMAPVWEGFYRSCPHRRLGVATAAKGSSRSLPINILHMTTETRRVILVRIISDIGKRRVFVRPGRHPVFCRQRMTRVAAFIFSFFMGPSVMREDASGTLRA